MNDENKPMTEAQIRIYGLTKSKNLEKLVEAQDLIDRAGSIIHDVNGVELALEDDDIFAAVGKFGLLIEKLMGTLAYNELCAFKKQK